MSVSVKCTTVEFVSELWAATTLWWHRNVHIIIINYYYCYCYVNYAKQ